MRACHVLLAGAAFLWTGCVNQMGLERDARELLGRCGVSPAKITATQNLRTRTGLIEFSASPEEVRKIVDCLKLVEVKPEERDSDRELSVGLREARSQYSHPLLAENADVLVFKSGRRTEELKLPGGSSFEYLLLYRERAGNRVLMQLSYAYG
jgi:hypothetical protein